MTLVDDPTNRAYPWPARPPGTTTFSSAGSARISAARNALLFWCVSDNLLKGAATNAVQIAEELLKLEPAAHEKPRRARC